MNTLFAYLLAGTFSLMGGEDTNAVMNPAALENFKTYVAEHVAFPSEVLEYGDAAAVNVSFTTDRSGALKVLSVEGGQPALEQQVVTSLEALQPAGTLSILEPGKPYYFTLRFKQL